MTALVGNLMRSLECLLHEYLSFNWHHADAMLHCNQGALQCAADVVCVFVLTTAQPCWQPTCSTGTAHASLAILGACQPDMLHGDPSAVMTCWRTLNQRLTGITASAASARRSRQARRRCQPRMALLTAMAAAAAAQVGGIPGRSSMGSSRISLQVNQPLNGPQPGCLRCSCNIAHGGRRQHSAAQRPAVRGRAAAAGQRVQQRQPAQPAQRRRPESSATVSVRRT